MTSLRTKAPTSHQASCAAVLRRRAPSKNVVQVPLLSALMEMARFAFTPEVRWNSNEEICQKTSCFSLFFSKTSQESHDHHYLPTIPSIFYHLFWCFHLFLPFFDDFIDFFILPFSHIFPEMLRGPSEVRPRSFRAPRPWAPTAWLRRWPHRRHRAAGRRPPPRPCPSPSMRTVLDSSHNYDIVHI